MSTRYQLVPALMLFAMLSGCAATVSGTAVSEGQQNGAAAGGGQSVPSAGGSGQAADLRTVNHCELVSKDTFGELGPRVDVSKDSAGMTRCELSVSVYDGKVAPGRPNGVLQGVTRLRVDTGVDYTDGQRFAAKQPGATQVQLSGGTGYQATDDTFGCIVATFPAGGAVQFSAQSNEGGESDCKVATLAANAGLSKLASGAAPTRSYPPNSLVSKDFCQLGDSAARTVLGSGVQQRPGGLFSCAWAFGRQAVTVSADDDVPGKLGTVPGMRPITVDGLSGYAGRPFNFPGSYQIQLDVQPSSVTPGQVEQLSVLLADTSGSTAFGEAQAKAVVNAVIGQLT